MAKYTYRIPPSSTETILTIDIPPATAVINQEAPLSSMSGGTPIPPVVVEPPVDPPTTGTGALTRYMDWSKPFVYGEVIAAKIGEGYYNTQSADAKAITNTTLNGAPALRMLWQYPWAASSSARSEVQSVAIDGKEGVDNYYSFSFQAKQWGVSPWWGESIFQFHPDGNSIPIPVSLQIQDSNTITLCIVVGNVTKRTPVGKIEIGRTQNWVVRVKWSITDGIAECWLDGVKKASYTGATLPGGTNVYSKIGLNFWGAFDDAKRAVKSGAPTREAIYGPYKVGKTYADVAP